MAVGQPQCRADGAESGQALLGQAHRFGEAIGIQAEVGQVAEHVRASVPVAVAAVGVEGLEQVVLCLGVAVLHAREDAALVEGLRRKHRVGAAQWEPPGGPGCVFRFRQSTGHDMEVHHRTVQTACGPGVARSLGCDQKAGVHLGVLLDGRTGFDQVFGDEHEVDGAA